MEILAKKAVRSYFYGLFGVLQCLHIACQFERWNSGNDRKSYCLLWKRYCRARESNISISLATTLIWTIEQEQYFQWSSKEQGLILSSFFYGYILTQFIGGYFGAKIGGSLVFGIGIFATSVLTLITPMAARAGVEVLMAVRIIEGIFEGVTFPCIQDVWSRWCPPEERSRASSIAFAGTYAGTVILYKNTLNHRL